MLMLDLTEKKKIQYIFFELMDFYQYISFILISMEQEEKINKVHVKFIKHAPSTAAKIKNAQKFPQLSITPTTKSNYSPRKLSYSKNLNIELKRLPQNIKSFILPEIRYFMLSSTLTKTNILSRKTILEAQKKMHNFHWTKRTFSLNPIHHLLEAVEERISDSSILTRRLEECLNKGYPPSLKMMLLYLGIFLCSVNCEFARADELCQVMFNQIVMMGINEYFMIYLLLRCRMKSNLRQEKCLLKFLSKLLIFSWLFKEKDLEIWCYFEFSKVYFSIDDLEEAEYFKKKSQMCQTEPDTSAFRLICERDLMAELQQLKSKGKNFTLNEIITQNRLKQIPKEIMSLKEMVSDQRRLQSQIKKITKQCGIKYVKNMLGRLSLCNFYKYSKICGQNLKLKYGDHTYRTHHSHIKNMNMFFRTKKPKDGEKINQFYTIENSTKNWPILKEMLKLISIEGMHLISEMESQNS